MQLQIGVSRHTKNYPWQWMRSFGLIIRFAITLSTLRPCHVFCDWLFYGTLSKTIVLFLVACVHYNYKWVTNSIVHFQIFSSVWNIENVIMLHEKGVSNVSSHSFQPFNSPFQMAITTKTNMPILILNYILYILCLYSSIVVWCLSLNLRKEANMKKKLYQERNNENIWRVEALDYSF
jgi:hypothetical protein